MRQTVFLRTRSRLKKKNHAVPLGPRMQGSMETPPLGLAEAFIAAGARTVVQKLWCDEESALVDTVSECRETLC